PKSPDEPTNRAAITIDISKINSNTKVYIDAACQNTANTIIASIKSYID
ncbi:30833_t:CDS:1, partial [Gigaspora margarita]